MPPLIRALQMVSLLHLAEIKEEGVTFQSPVDGTEMLLTPEESISIQNRLGVGVCSTSAFMTRYRGWSVQIGCGAWVMCRDRGRCIHPPGT